jgi:ABC-type glycerol-3-phosphate transport system substrate-binding protein
VSLKIVMDPRRSWTRGACRTCARRSSAKAFPGADEYLDDAIEKSFPSLVPDPIIPGSNEYTRKLSFEITEARAKRKAPTEALDAAAAEWNKITERRRPDRQRGL